MFTANEVFPGITHIRDAMGVCFTLIEGEEQALLFDTGYGLENNAEAFVRTLTAKPVTVLLSHAHHDHILGARWFGTTIMCQEDQEEFLLRTGREQRSSVARQARGLGISVPEDYLTAPIPMPEPIRFDGKAGPFDRKTVELGNLEAWVIRVPGHTPGSVVLYLPARSLLLTADDWNPCTWMWFPSSLPADRWRENMLNLIRTLEEEGEGGIRHVLCSHQPMRRDGTELKQYLDYMTVERMQKAPPIGMGAEIRTHEASCGERGWQLVFDMDKLGTVRR